MSDDEIEFWLECVAVANSDEYAKKYDPSTGRIAAPKHNAWTDSDDDEE